MILHACRGETQDFWPRTAQSLRGTLVQIHIATKPENSPRQAWRIWILVANTKLTKAGCILPIPPLILEIPMTRLICNLALSAAVSFLAQDIDSCFAQATAELRGTVVDAETKLPLAARVYLKSSDGKWHFVRSADAKGQAVEYRKDRSPQSVEVHTTVSAHPFLATLPLGKYQLTVERGKEYFTFDSAIDLGAQGQTVTVPLRRWSDMASLGWYSGETHVHRSLGDLPTAMLAEDLNVALPLTYWVTTANTPPVRGDKNSPEVSARPIDIDATHVIYPMNTEYEIFRVGDKPHTLGAIFGLNHREPLALGAPPVRPIAEIVHAQGGLLELDKHNWPWSMMLVPIMQVDLYELSNNHMWRTEFMFRQWGELPPDYMHVERDAGGVTEHGWLDFTLQNYYLLLNCGFRLRPTGGTASGVHPVPLGWGRVYVHLPEGFSYNAWMKGLNAGRCFVTTGPMLVATFNGRSPGESIKVQENSASKCRIQGFARSAHQQTAIEILSAGQIVRHVKPINRRLPSGAFETEIDETLEVNGSSWFAVRCFEQTEDQRIRFAHSAPFFMDDASRPLRPRREEVQYLVDRMQREIARNEGVATPVALDEYREALRVFEGLMK